MRGCSRGGGGQAFEFGVGVEHDGWEEEGYGGWAD